jgi:hypothetical protein
LEFLHGKGNKSGGRAQAFRYGLRAGQFKAVSKGTQILRGSLFPRNVDNFGSLIQLFKTYENGSYFMHFHTFNEPLSRLSGANNQHFNPAFV